MAYRGSWRHGAVYAVGDTVDHRFESFTCAVAHTASDAMEPDVGATWDTNWDRIGAADTSFDEAAGGGGGEAAPLVLVLVSAGTDQAIDNSDNQPINFSVEHLDADGFHDAGAPSRLTVPADLDGTYRVYGKVAFYEPGAACNIQLRVWKNGTAGTLLARAAGRNEDNAGEVINITFDFPVALVATDYIQVTAWPTSSLSVMGHASEKLSYVGLQRLGD